MQLLIFSKCSPEGVFSPQHPQLGRTNAQWQESGLHMWPQPCKTFALEMCGCAGMAAPSRRPAVSASGRKTSLCGGTESYSEMSTEPTQAAALLAGVMDDAEWFGVASL